MEVGAGAVLILGSKPLEVLVLFEDLPGGLGDYQVALFVVVGVVGHYLVAATVFPYALRLIKAVGGEGEFVDEGEFPVVVAQRLLPHLVQIGGAHNLLKFQGFYPVHYGFPHGGEGDGLQYERVEVGVVAVQAHIVGELVLVAGAVEGLDGVVGARVRRVGVGVDDGFTGGGAGAAVGGHPVDVGGDDAVLQRLPVLAPEGVAGLVGVHFLVGGFGAEDGGAAAEGDSGVDEAEHGEAPGGGVGLLAFGAVRVAGGGFLLPVGDGVKGGAFDGVRGVGVSAVARPDGEGGDGEAWHQEGGEEDAGDQKEGT